MAAGNTGELRFIELPANGTNYIGFKAPDLIGTSNNAVRVLPNKDGTVGQVLSTTFAFSLLTFRTVGSRSTHSSCFKQSSP